MRKIIDGVLYDTEKANLICDLSPMGLGPSDFSYEDTGLYSTKSGRFFLAGEGGPKSRWSRSSGQNTWTGGSGVQPIERAEAVRLASPKLTPEEYAEAFGEPPMEA